MRTIILGSCLCLGAFVYGQEESPWLGDPYAFSLRASFLYDQYRKVQGAITQPTEMIRDYVSTTAISFAPSANLMCGWDLEMAKTPKQSYGFRSSALFAKWSLLDDVAGDPVSIAIGVSLRGVTGRAVRDISSPYAAYWNLEASCSLGKEFASLRGEWTTRGGVCAAVGIGNRGAPWNRVLLFFEDKFRVHHIVRAFALGYFGYGSAEKIDITAFRGWGFVHHQSIDMGLQYRYHFALWGDLGLSYAYRVFARLYPEKTQVLEVSYSLPFSLF